MRAVLLLLLLTLSLGLRARSIVARFTPEAPAIGQLYLYSTIGTRHTPIDSARVANGVARFRTDALKPGFYQLAANDTDRVDIILDAADTVAEFEFSGLPLQRHTHVLRSDDNIRLWEYKAVSRQAQALRTAAAEERKQLKPTDVMRAAHLDSMVNRSVLIQREQLTRLAAQAPGSVFSKVVRADMALEGTRGRNPMAVAEAVDFSSGIMLRSSVYDKAVMYFLNNLNAVSEEQFNVASDTLIDLAARDPECRTYMIEHLVDLFSTYGPDLALQHLVDGYVVPEKGRTPFSRSTLQQVSELLEVSVGSPAPSIILPLQAGPVAVKEFAARQKFTAIFFYSSTCDHCHAQMPKLKELYAAYKAKGFEVVGIALDTDTAEFQKGLADNGLIWPSGSEYNGWGSTVAKAFRVKATPWFYLLDQKGMIVAKPYDAEAMATELARLLP